MADTLEELQRNFLAITLKHADCARPFATKAEIDNAYLAILNCQEGDDDLMCLKCQAKLERLRVTALSVQRPASANGENDG